MFKNQVKKLYCKHTTFFYFALISLITLATAGCSKKNTYSDPDVSNIPMEVHAIRFEQQLMRANGSNYRTVLDSLKMAYPEFFSLYFNDILSIPLRDTAYNAYDTIYKYIITDKYMLRLYDSVSVIYPTVSDVEADIKKAFQYYHYYFPEDTLPQVYTYIAPFVYQVFLGDSVLGIELNMFMGKHFSYYSSFAANMPQYMLYNFDKKNIAVQVMRMLQDKRIPGRGPEASLLDDMIAEGKMMYYLDRVLPGVPDSVKIGYSAAQIKWCEDNAEDIWKFFAGEELLLSTRTQDKQRYIGDAPTSYNMPGESPGKMGVWLGWQIIRAYMDQNKEMPLTELFADTNSLEILKQSNYEGK